MVDAALVRRHDVPEGRTVVEDVVPGERETGRACLACTPTASSPRSAITSAPDSVGSMCMTSQPVRANIESRRPRQAKALTNRHFVVLFPPMESLQ